ncbi:MAG: hypothetical protein ACOY3D_02190 [Candidatus Omnitrophota bacterium]
MFLTERIFEILRFILLGLTPLVFIEGLLLLLVKEQKYEKIEATLSKEFGVLKRKVVPWLENNIYSFQRILLKKKVFLGVFFVVYSALMFFVLMQ